MLLDTARQLTRGNKLGGVRSLIIMETVNQRIQSGGVRVMEAVTSGAHDYRRFLKGRGRFHKFANHRFG